MQSILYVIIIACQIIGFLIIGQQIKSKDSVIKDLKLIIDATDFKRLADYYKRIDELRKRELMSVARREVDKGLQEFSKTIRLQYDEACAFAASIIIVLPKADRLPFVEMHFPNSLDVFQEYLSYPEYPTLYNAETDLKG